MKKKKKKGEKGKENVPFSSENPLTRKRIKCVRPERGTPGGHKKKAPRKGGAREKVSRADSKGGRKTPSGNPEKKEHFNNEGRGIHIHTTINQQKLSPSKSF